MSLKILGFERSNRDLLKALINLHVAAVIPGVALSVTPFSRNWSGHRRGDSCPRWINYEPPVAWPALTRLSKDWRGRRSLGTRKRSWLGPRQACRYIELTIR